MTRYIPQQPTPKQAAFLLLPHREVLYGGAAGGGKSSALLMAALQYVDVPNYAALILRRTYADLSLPGALMDRAAEWLAGTDAHWNSLTKTWRFPSGATLSFGYLDSEGAKFRYQGSEIQFCVAVGTPIRMADGTLRAIETLRVGDMVDTLAGARPVTHIHTPRWDDCVTANVYDDGQRVGSDTFPLNHRFLTARGWMTYDDLRVRQSKRFHADGNTPAVYSASRPKFDSLPASQWSGQAPCAAPRPQSLPETHHRGRAAYSEDDQICNADHWAVSQAGQPLVPLSVPVVLRSLPDRSSAWASDLPECASAGDAPQRAAPHWGTACVGSDCTPPGSGPPPQCCHAQEWPASLAFHRVAALAHWNADSDERDRRARSDFRAGYQHDRRSGDGRAQLAVADALTDRTQPGDAVAPSPGYLPSDDLWRTPLHSRGGLTTYRHPYTMERRNVQGRAVYGEAWLTPVGRRQVVDLTIGDASHYITQAGLVHTNCGFDELTQFTESQYRYLFSRLRRLAGHEHVPLRMRAGSNPGGVGHQWVFERFVATAKDPDRLFVPAGLADNPYVDQAEYTKSLLMLDDITRRQLLEGLWVVDPAGKPFLPEWWQGQNRYAASDARLRNQVVARWLSFDTALKDEEDNAYTASVVGELLPDYRIVTRRVWRDRLIFPDLPNAIQQQAEAWNQDGKLTAVLIEDKASGTSAYQTLLRTAPAWLAAILIAFQPSGDKLQRAQQASVWCKRGCVLLPAPGDDVPWLYDFEQEMWGFPLSTFKDQVDAFSQLLIYTENLLAAGWQARQGNGGGDGEGE